MMASTLAPFTPLFQPFNASDNSGFWNFHNGSLFSVNEDILNRMLANLTLSDGGFLQLLTTTRGSATLDKIAISGCLGGDRNVPSELRDLKIQYGEISLPLDSRGGQAALRTAGFGTEDEVLALRKGYSYGG